ncbi:hypothetical protein AWB64_02219 [Caballeronia sordidicola]|uniref:Lipoprotein n=1 Tax=Caballeronia sordidicola TaxID=196367 RepID=A0A158G3U7_CABSO|nr:hypothetical protein AWB64_02219 [Caballeronia sordidicola]
MKRLALITALAVLIGSSLGGCIVVPDGGGYHHHDYYGRY